MSRYKKVDIEWLLDRIREAMSDGRATAKEACELLLEEWNKRTGVENVLDALLGTYYRHKSKSQPPLSADSVECALKPGEVVGVQEINGKFVKLVPTMTEALKEVNGGVKNYQFYACRKLQVEYKTIIVVKSVV